jgi:RimJ/RimL family protein N-acetyltransferase
MTDRERALLPRAGPRVALRRLRAGDLAAFQAYRRDEAVSRFQGWAPLPDDQAGAFLAEMADAPLFARGRWVQIGVADIATDMLIGDIGVCLAAAGEEVEIGFSLSAAFQGRGLAREAVGAAIELIFEATGATRVVATVDARNIASIRLLERLAMTRTGSAPATFRGAPCVEHAYARSRRDRA